MAEKRNQQPCAFVVGIACMASILLAAAEAPGAMPQGGAADAMAAFVKSHCVGCHGFKTQEGDLALHNLSTDLSESDAAKTWTKVFEKIQLGEMPPEDEPQPDAAARQRFLETLQVELAHAGVELDAERLLRPEFGNYVDHEKLFDGSVTELPATVSRVWLNKNVSDSSPGEFSDYAALKKLDEATTQRDLRNIEQGLEKIVTAIKDGKPWLGGGYPMAEIVRKRHRATDGIDLSGKTPASREMINADVLRAFEALRRPEPSEKQLAYYADFVQRVIQEQDNEAGFRALLMALALDPDSLYRSELGRGPVDEHGRRMLSAQEIQDAYAYRFSPNSLWRIDTDELHTREGIDQVARQVVDSRFAMDAYREFFRQYFGYVEAIDVFKGERHARHHHKDKEMAAVLINELEALIYRIVLEDRDVLRRLLTTDRIFVTARGVKSNYDRNNGITSIRWAEPELDREPGLEKRIEEYRSEKFRDVAQWAREHAVFDWGWHLVETKESNPLDRRHTSYHERYAQGRFAYLDYYGLEPTQKDVDRFAAQLVKLSQKDEKGKQLYRVEPMKSPVPRAGVLTHPAWLLAKSTFDHSDVVRRGKWIREKLLGGTIPDVPIGVNAAVPPDEDKTLRERMQVTRDQYCWRCHVKMDPLGMPFEIYDDFGRFRKSGKERRPDGEFVDLDASGEIIRSGEPQLDGKVDDAIELMNKLAASERVRQVFVRHAFRFFLGRNETLRDSKTLIEADRAYVESGGSFKALVHSLVTSDSFLYRIPPSGRYELPVASQETAESITTDSLKETVK